MFGMGGSEIVVILIVALIFLGPDKLPGAAKSISKGIRDLKKQSRALQSQIESDEQIGGAIRDLKSALRGDELYEPPRPRKPPVAPEVEAAAAEAALAAPPAEPPAEAHSILDPDRASDAPALEVSERAILDTKPVLPSVLAKPAEPPRIKLPSTAGEPGEVEEPGGDDDLASLIKPAPGSIAKGS